MRRNGLVSLIFIVVLAAGGLVYTFAAGNEPMLGLDLQGGVSVVLEPSEEANDDAVSQAVEIIRQRVDGLGVAEPEIARQGDAVVVQLPGVKDRDRALELVGQTAELRFRPVLQVIPPELVALQEEQGDADTTTTTAPAGDSSTTSTAPTDTTSGDEQGLGLAPGEVAAPVQEGDGTTTTTTTTAPAEEAPTTTAPSIEDALGDLELTPPEDDVADQPVTLAEYDENGEELFRYRLGPTAATGDEVLSGAQAQLEGLGTWQVGVDLSSDGINTFNEIAGQCFSATEVCPTGQLAIVLDSQVQSAPRIQQPSFTAAQGVAITGSFDEARAKDLALVLEYGSLPVEFEPQQTQSVSASIGKDALDAGIVAGLVGLFLVALYMILYYRLLGVVAMLSLSVSAALLWTMISWLGENQGLALTLAGVTGIIVSIGVAVDSNVVFYEHLKEDMSRGRTMRTAVDGAFKSSFSTIVKADVASLIGAAILYFLTVGPVRGFALYLGLSTFLDLVASWFFMRPLALILVKSPKFQTRPRLFGMPAADDEVVPA